LYHHLFFLFFFASLFFFFNFPSSLGISKRRSFLTYGYELRNHGNMYVIRHSEALDKLR
jgi:hypothetical protein